MRQHIAPILAALSLVSAAALPPAHAAEAPAAQPKVEFVTTMGNFVVQLDPARAPKTVANFLDYVKSGFYKGTIFHRVIAMARTSDPNSATSQFFVNVVDNPSLDYPKPDGYGYAVFGKVISGMNVIEKIVAVPTKSEGMFQDVPVKPIVIEDAKLLN
ncbi:MAG: peptidylprolyl isomerase [Thiomonas sp. 14-64-326]|nr:MAG: peptidylprolyl isomerase [Thiomonas sp. 14-64-326]